LNAAILPIIFWTKFPKPGNNDIDTEKVLDKLEQYFIDNDYNYIRRLKNKLIFHKMDGFSFMRFKDFLVSGKIKVIEKKDSIIVINGNWMIFLLLIPFMIFYALANSEYSTIDQNEIESIWNIFWLLFLLNLLARIIAHYMLKDIIIDLIE